MYDYNQKSPLFPPPVFLSLQPNEVIDLVVNYILLTKAHQVGPENPDVDLKLFIDIDMSVLGQMQEGKSVDCG